MRVLFSILVAIIFLSISRPSQSGVLMVSEESSFDNPELKRTIKMYLDRQKIRIEMIGEQTEQVMIFRMDLEKFWVINFKDSTYMEITKKDLEKMGQQMAELKKTMDEKMKEVPPEQRKYLEQMMKGKMSSDRPEIVYKKVAGGQKVNLWDCDQYAGNLEGELKEDLWTADWKKIGMTDENIQALQELAEYFKSFSRQAPSFFKSATDKSGKRDLGAPVKSVTYRNGEKQRLVQLTEVSQKDLGPELFELAGKLKKKKMPQDARD